jgi:hypothetical protein
MNTYQKLPLKTITIEDDKLNDLTKPDIDMTYQDIKAHGNT